MRIETRYADHHDRGFGGGPGRHGASDSGKTLCTAFADTVAARGDAEALKWRTADGTWHAHTWRQYRERVRDLTLALREMGLGRGDFAVIMTRNRPEHVIADLAILHAGATPVSLYNTLAPEQIAYIAGHCEARVAIVEDAAFLERFAGIRAQLPRLQRVIVVEPFDRVEPVGAGGGWVTPWNAALARGAELSALDPGAFDASWKAVQPDDLATLVYTSGTTGHPKGVMDTHRAVLWMGESFRRLENPTHEAHVISYLPLAHAAERTSTHWMGDGWDGPPTSVPIPRRCSPSRAKCGPRASSACRACGRSSAPEC